MVERFAAALGGLHRDFAPLLDLRLSREFFKPGRPQRALQRGIGLGKNISNYSVSHRTDNAGRKKSAARGKRTDWQFGETEMPQQKEKARAIASPGLFDKHYRSLERVLGNIAGRLLVNR